MIDGAVGALVVFNVSRKVLIPVFDSRQRIEFDPSECFLRVSPVVSCMLQYVRYVLRKQQVHNASRNMATTERSSLSQAPPQKDGALPLPVTEKKNEAGDRLARCVTMDMNGKRRVNSALRAPASRRLL
eukprot:scaffold22660_cov127-Cylindrotheca_fusiformis.AAC.2